MQEERETRRLLHQLIADSRAARQRARAVVERAEELCEWATFVRQRPKTLYADILCDRPAP